MRNAHHSTLAHHQPQLIDSRHLHTTIHQACHPTAMTSNSPKTENLFPKRYSRLEIIQSIGKEGLQKIRQGKVFILGCGALGSLSAMYLAASGVGTIGIADFDTIDATNLQRQLFYSEDIVGSSKVLELANKMSRLNSDIHLEVFNEMITARKAEKIFAGYDFIIDGSDNMSTKQMTSSVCEKINKPYCIGGVEGFAGQVMSWTPGHTGYCGIFGEGNSCSGIIPCAVKGVVGPAAGIVASYQASEAIKFLTGAGNMLYDKLLNFDLLSPSSEIFSIE